MLNEYSENKELFNEDEKSELIFKLFRTITIGGALCQADDSIDRLIC